MIRIFVVVLMLFSVSVSLASQVVHSNSGGVVAVDRSTGHLSPAETAILSENFLSSQRIIIDKMKESVAFTFKTRDEAIRFSELLFIQGIESVNRPSQVKHIHSGHGGYKVFLSHFQYHHYQENILCYYKMVDLKNHQAYGKQTYKPSLKQTVIESIKQSSLNPKVTRPVNQQNASRKKHVIQLTVA